MYLFTVFLFQLHKIIASNWLDSRKAEHKACPKQQILDSSKPKEFADDNVEFDESGRKFSKSAENTAEKGEIACYQQFLLFPKCFQKNFTAET